MQSFGGSLFLSADRNQPIENIYKGIPYPGGYVAFTFLAAVHKNTGTGKQTLIRLCGYKQSVQRLHTAFNGKVFGNQGFVYWQKNVCHFFLCGVYGVKYMGGIFGKGSRISFGIHHPGVTVPPTLSSYSPRVGITGKQVSFSCVKIAIAVFYVFAYGIRSEIRYGYFQSRQNKRHHGLCGKLVLYRHIAGYPVGSKHRVNYSIVFFGVARYHRNITVAVALAYKGMYNTAYRRRFLKAVGSRYYLYVVRVAFKNGSGMVPQKILQVFNTFFLCPLVVRKHQVFADRGIFLYLFAAKGGFFVKLGVFSDKE